MGLFDDSFETSNEELNYLGTFVKDNNETITFYENYRPLHERTDSRYLADKDLQKAIKMFQNVAPKAGIDPAIGQIRVKELEEKEKTLRGYPDDVYIVRYKPLGQHRNPKDSDGSFIDIDWDYIKSHEGKDAVNLFVVVLTHEYMHESMKTDKTAFYQAVMKGFKE